MDTPRQIETEYDALASAAQRRRQAADMTDPFAANRAPPQVPPRGVDAFSQADQEKRAADAFSQTEQEKDAPATAREVREKLSEAEKRIEGRFLEWGKFIWKKTKELARLMQQAVASGTPLVITIGVRTFTFSVELVQAILTGIRDYGLHALDHVYEPHTVFFMLTMGFIAGTTIVVNSRLMNSGIDACINKPLNELYDTPQMQFLNNTIYKMSFGLDWIQRPAERPASDMWADVLFVGKGMGLGWLAGLPSGAALKTFVGMLLYLSQIVRFQQSIPRPPQLQEMRKASVAIREIQAQPPPPPDAPPDSAHILALKLATRAIDILEQREAPSRPALPDAQAASSSSSSSSSSRPVYPTGLSGAPSLPRPPQQQALPAPAAAPEAAAPPAAAPQRRVRAFVQQGPAAVSQAEQDESATGKGKPKRKRVRGIPVKEVLNIPKPILEYFDVKNDPHFIRAHRPTAPK